MKGVCSFPNNSWAKYSKLKCVSKDESEMRNELVRILAVTLLNFPSFFFTTNKHHNKQKIKRFFDVGCLLSLVCFFVVLCWATHSCALQLSVVLHVSLGKSAL